MSTKHPEQDMTPFNTTTRVLRITASEKLKLKSQEWLLNWIYKHFTNLETLILAISCQESFTTQNEFYTEFQKLEKLNLSLN